MIPVVYRGSAIGDFCRCKKRAYWRWFRPEGLLQSREESSALSIGSATHEGAHLWYKHLHLDVESRWMIVETHLTNSKYPQEIIEEALRLLKALKEQYPEEDFDVVHPEVTVWVRMIEEYPLYLQATLDGVIQLRTGQKQRPMLVLEHKTSAVGKGPIITSYLRSPQIISYVWICRQMKYPVVGGMYNFFVKVKEAYVMRQATTISPFLMKKWKTFFLRTVAEIELCKERNDWPEDIGRCFDRFGECPYRKLCYAQGAPPFDLYREPEPDPIREETIIVEGDFDHED